MLAEFEEEVGKERADGVVGTAMKIVLAGIEDDLAERRLEPEQKPHRSKQDYETPPEFLIAVARRFGPIWIDLAASAENAKAKLFFDEAANSFVQDWAKAVVDFVGWLNPPFGNLDEWAKKCALEAKRLAPRAVVVMLCPASVGTNWWAEHVDGHAAEVLMLRPRISFVDTSAPYPKDLSLVVYRGETEGGTMYRPWRWRR